MPEIPDDQPSTTQLETNSFVEHVNNLSNAASLATGDIVEDTQAARDLALEAALRAMASAQDAEESETLAADWATKGYGLPVLVGEYSAYHWAEQAMVNSFNARMLVIKDDTIEDTYTWSSSKIHAQAALKSDITHDHNGIYDPYVSIRQTAYDRPYSLAALGGGSSDAGNAFITAREDHKHDLVYEDLLLKADGITIGHGTALNKDFGIGTGNVSEGTHIHDGANGTPGYEPLLRFGGVAGHGTALNKNFVALESDPQAEEVPRGTHVHPAEKITYNLDQYLPFAGIIKSRNVEGALHDLDVVLEQYESYTKTRLNAGLPDGTALTVPYTSPNERKITSPNMSSNLLKNAAYSVDGIEIAYTDILSNSDKPGAEGNHLVEGQYDVTATITGQAGAKFTISFATYDGVTWVELPNYQATGISTGTEDLTLSLSSLITGIYDKNALNRGPGNPYKIGVLVSSTLAADIVITGMTMSWAGIPEGGVVSASTIVDHNSVTGRGSAAQHPTESIYKTGNTGISLDTVLSGLPLKATTIADGNIVAQDSNGDLVDTGIHYLDPITHMDYIPVTGGVTGHIIVAAVDGNSSDSGVLLSGLAGVNGNSANLFHVKDGTATTEAVNFSQLASLTTYTTGMIPKATATIGNFPIFANDGVGTSRILSDSGKSASDFSPSGHGHSESDISGLTTSLSGKMPIVTGATANNIATFNGDVVKDSTIGISTLLSKVGGIMTGHITGVTSPAAANLVRRDWVEAQVVNDLTSGGTEVPLSAEQGKALDGIKPDSDVFGIAGATNIINMVSLTESAYQTLVTAGTTDPKTLYVVI